MKKPLLFAVSTAVIALGFGQSGFAFQSFDCVAKVTGKAMFSEKKAQKSFKLVEGQRSLISFDDVLTGVDVGVNVGSQEGLSAYLVNGSYYNLPAANSNLGSLVTLSGELAEVALQCKKAASVDTYVVSNFTRNIISLNEPNASCYEGNSQKVAAVFPASLRKASAKSQISKSGVIRVTQTEDYCANGEGTNVDDYVCHAMGKHDVTYPLPRCASLAKTEDVCVASALVDVPPNGPGMGVTQARVCSSRGAIEIR